jgi:phosphoribosylformylglycinamidine synthase
MHHVLIGESCYTASEVQKLVQRINDQSPVKVAKLTGSWQYYLDLETEDAAVLGSIKKILEAIEQPTNAPSTGDDKKAIDIYVSPRNVSPWSSKATSIALVCDLKTVNRIERGRVIHIEPEDGFKGEEDLSFRDILHDRMTEFFSLSPPALDTMFAHGARNPLVIVDIFSDERGPLAALQDHNKQAGLGLDQPNMEYLVKQYTALGRSPV